MEKKNGYPLIDVFRVIAAVLIVAIHISPLEGLTETGDFVLTRVVARLAVPFFFMTSGFFLLRPPFDFKKLLGFVKRTAIIYLIATVIYIPVNIYDGYFTRHTVLGYIKDILFDGTFYHLWYLPAAIMGAVIAWLLLRYAGKIAAVAVSAVLYIVGVFGDSWFGLIKGSFIEPVYKFIFIFTDHTRCGLFFAPLFFVLGALLFTRKKTAPLRDGILLAVSLAVLTAEALLVKNLGFIRHDSMYFALVPASLFLFSLLSSFRGERKKSLATVAAATYIIHPMMIIAVRLAAKLISPLKILVDSRLLLFIVVTVISLAVSFLFAFVLGKIKKKGK